MVRRSTDEAVDPSVDVPRRGRRRVLVLLAVLSAILVVVIVGVVTRTSAPALAQLRVRHQTVEVGHGTGGFTSAKEGRDINANDIVRTSSRGQAVVDYSIGALTRLDSDTKLTILELTNATKSPVVRLEMDTGRSWNRVDDQLTSAGGRYELVIPGAVVSVHGTTFFADCRTAGTCSVVGVDGSTDLATTAGSRVTLQTNDCAAVHPDGSTATCDAKALEDLWIRENLAEDEQLAAQETPTPTPSTALETVTPRRFVPHPRPVANPTPSPTRRPTPAPTPSKKPKPTIPSERTPTPEPTSSAPPTSAAPRS